MKVIVLRYPRNHITDILISLFCVFLITLIMQTDNYYLRTDALLSDKNYVEEYFNSYGWEIDVNSVVYSRYVFTDKNNPQFLSYNELQLKQGYDLMNFIGVELDKYSVRILNFPSDENSDSYYGTVFFYDGLAVAGDIYDARLNGYMYSVIKDVNYE